MDIFSCTHLSFIKSYMSTQSLPRINNFPVNDEAPTTQSDLNIPSLQIPATEEFRLYMHGTGMSYCNALRPFRALVVKFNVASAEW